MKMMEVRGERNLVADVRDTTSAQEGHCILSADLKLYSLLNAFLDFLAPFSQLTRGVYIFLTTPGRLVQITSNIASMATVLLSKSERAYIQSSLKATPPLRADGRGLLDFRTVLLETGVAPLANGSARLNIGKMAREGGGGTEIVAAVKLEVEDVENGDGIDGGRVVCSVTWCVTSVAPIAPKSNSSILAR